MKRKTLYNFNIVQLTFNQNNTICTVRDSTIRLTTRLTGLRANFSIVSLFFLFDTVIVRGK